jgi:hypothetical protein
MVLGPFPVIVSAVETSQPNTTLSFADDQRPDSIKPFKSGQTC